MSPQWLPRKAAAAYLRSIGFPIAARTLARLATRKQGPSYRKIGYRTVLYDREALETWAQAQTITGP